jgi:Ni,Fe-hydrogenase I large subunit
MNARIVVDPITRIEGHLRIEAQMDGDQIAEAWSSGTMVRGIEIILRGRDPRDAWAFTQRICGVCTLVHGIASIRAVENALNYEIPPNAQLIRNLMIGAQYIHDHVMHFYHLHALDWVDVVSALQADPKATSELAQSISNYSKSSPGYFESVLGTPRIQVATRSQPDGSRSLPRGAELAKRRFENTYDIWWQESASEFPGRRRPLPDRSRLGFSHQLRAPRDRAANHHANARFR